MNAIFLDNYVKKQAEVNEEEFSSLLYTKYYFLSISKHLIAFFAYEENLLLLFLV